MVYEIITIYLDSIIPEKKNGKITKVYIFIPLQVGPSGKLTWLAGRKMDPDWGDVFPIWTWGIFHCQPFPIEHGKWVYWRVYSLYTPNKNSTELGVNFSSQTSTLSKPSDKAKHLEPKCHKLLGTLHQWLPMPRLWLDNLPLLMKKELRESLTSWYGSWNPIIYRVL